jgi:hypothetical protein
METGFLLARDERFCRIVDQVNRKAKALAEGNSSIEEHTTGTLIAEIQTYLQPYNDVGLFSPAIRNMILHTTAAK